MKFKPLLLALSLSAASGFAMADYCDDTLGDVVAGAIDGGLVGTAAGAIADGGEGAKRGAAIGGAIGAIDGLVEGEVKRDRCKRDLEDIEDAIIEQEFEDAYIEDVIFDD
ncbi:hypothetical protein L1D32_17575 [Shewanella insulae]|uniref:hypothetical protein n=1 Tax=Shewanella insulae TaxID=2681496 RepID=UPI001EFCCBB4|nr:hypothetical protein [Shewanella insulae]MCG9739977.1 hypothetical protein [Shewanella insulae]